MAIRKRKKSKAAHKRTKKTGATKRRLRAKIMTGQELTKHELKQWYKVGGRYKHVMGRPGHYGDADMGQPMLMRTRKGLKVSG